MIAKAKDDVRTKCYAATEKYVTKKKPQVVLIEMVKGVLVKKMKKTVFLKWIHMFLGWMISTDYVCRAYCSSIFSIASSH